jgi:hypothetical protein
LRLRNPLQSLAPWVRQEIAHIDPTIPVEIETMNERVSKLADGPRFEAALLAFFAFRGLTMAVIGLNGLTSYIAQRRTQEIGARMALGAGRADILRLHCHRRRARSGRRDRSYPIPKESLIQHRPAQPRDLCRSRSASGPCSPGRDADSGARSQAG